MNAKNNMYVNTKKHKKINEFINLRVILFVSATNGCDSKNAKGSFKCNFRSRSRSRLMLAIIGMLT